MITNEAEKYYDFEGITIIFAKETFNDSWIRNIIITVQK
jgi:hypothetical protein